MDALFFWTTLLNLNHDGHEGRRKIVPHAPFTPTNYIPEETSRAHCWARQ
jgi:hypothetical protein